MFVIFGALETRRLVAEADDTCHERPTAGAGPYPWPASTGRGHGLYDASRGRNGLPWRKDTCRVGPRSSRRCRWQHRRSPCRTEARVMSLVHPDTRTFTFLWL